jgi:hypothetical protein
MDPSLLIPVPDSIPVHYSWLNIFLILTFILHILFVNTMLGTCIIAFVKSFKSTKDDLITAKEISLKLPYTIAFAINVGVAPFLFIQMLYGNFIYTSSILMGWYWLMIIPILIIAYYSAYLFDFKFDSLGSKRNIVIAFCTALLLLIGFLFMNNITLMTTPEKWSQYFASPGGTILNLTEPTLIPRFLHFVCASIAVGGLFLAIVGKQKNKAGFDKMISSGMKWFFYATLVQILIGVWFLMSLPKEIASIFMGGNYFATLLLVLGFILTCMVLFFGFKNRIWLSAVTTMLTIIIMVIMRDIMRTAYLEPYFSLSDLKIEPQYSPMFFFLITAIIGISVITYMLRLAITSRKEI